jgi:hypothetical protein
MHLFWITLRYALRGECIRWHFEARHRYFF